MLKGVALIVLYVEISCKFYIAMMARFKKLKNIPEHFL